MTTPIVLSLGELLWDMLPSGKRAGGAPVNFAYHAMKNGTEGWAISAVGEDELGDELIAKADEAGINTVLQRNAWPTSTVEVALKNGIPEYTIVKGVAWDHILYTRQLIDVVSKADAVCFGTLALRSPESHATITELLKHTKPGAMKFFDINLRGDHYSKELIEELLKVATVFKINDEELLLLRDMFDIRGTSGEDASRWFLEEFDLDYVILTAGSAYSTIISRKGEVSTLDTPRVEVNDTVGAPSPHASCWVTRSPKPTARPSTPPPSSAPRPVPGPSTRPRCPTIWLKSASNPLPPHFPDGFAALYRQSHLVQRSHHVHSRHRHRRPACRHSDHGSRRHHRLLRASRLRMPRHLSQR